MTYRAGTLKIIDHVVTLKSIKGQSLESNIAAALGLKLHHPIMSKLWGLVDQTQRQTGLVGKVASPRIFYLMFLELLVSNILFL